MIIPEISTGDTVVDSVSAFFFSQEAGQVVWYSSLFKNFPQFIVNHTVKSFSIVNEADIFLEFPYFFSDAMDVGNLISGSSAFSKSSLKSGISQFTYLLG